MLQPGDFEVDFEFTIPKDIPASFYYLYDISAKIPLWIKHTLKFKMEDAMGKDLLNYKCPLIIRDKPSNDKEKLKAKD